MNENAPALQPPAPESEDCNSMLRGVSETRAVAHTVSRPRIALRLLMAQMLAVYIGDTHCLLEVALFFLA